jgi:hypothetical protein
MLSLVSVMAQTDGKLTVTATTSKTSSPEYSPKNIVAIWIEDNSGKFVQTILAYADERKQYLKAWKTSTAIAGSAYNVVDASTGATQKSHGTRSHYWMGKNYKSVAVSDGDYKVKMEVTDNDGVAQNLATFTFSKGPNPVTITPATTNGFSNISIEWVPTNTALLEISSDDLYNIYPNPAMNSIFVNGIDIKSIVIINQKGQQMLSTINQSIDISQLQSGLYFCSIETENGLFYKKFIKK